MWLLIGGVAVFLIPGLWAMRRARRELADDGRVSLPTFFAALLCFVGHAVMTVLAAISAAWPLPIDRYFALATGGVLALLGAGTYLSARLQFRSFHLTWGLDSSRLVTTGIYRFSRNPQTVGSILFLGGIALGGRSGVAMLLVGLLLIGALAWLPLEEEALQQLFGERYARYRAATRRFIGIRRRNMAT